MIKKNEVSKMQIFKIIALFLIFVSFTTCNLFTKYGKVEIHINKHKKYISDLDTIEIWCPYNYYCINWQVFVYENREPNFGAKGSSKGDKFFGSYHWMNNYMDSNLLNIDSLNKILQKIEPEKPYLIWFIKHKSDQDSSMVKGYELLMFTKNHEIYYDEKKMLEIAKSYDSNK
jgi:hypothetical protein